MSSGEIIGSDRGYLAAASGLLRASGFSSSPAELVRRWESFVEDCRAGYEWDISEYDNEIRVRKALDLVLEAECLQRYPEIRQLAEVVRSIDDRFRPLLQSDVERPGRHSWYESGVMRRAGQAYVEYFQSAYGIDVEPIDSVGVV